MATIMLDISFTRRDAGKAAAVLFALGLAAGPAAADDPLLTEAVNFAGAITWLGAGAPGLVIAAIRDGETAVAGFGETARGSGREPDGDTLMRIASISKAFCGNVMGSMVADGTLTLTDPVQAHLPEGFVVPQKDGRTLRLVDLVTQASGLPREVPQTGGTPDDPFGGNTMQAQMDGLAGDPFLFPPGTGALYSNWGYDLLGIALGQIAGKPYADLLAERVLTPRGMTSTKFNLEPGEDANAMQGHNFDGSALPFVRSPETIHCAGGLYTTANDMLKWMAWHLDRDDATDAAWRRMSHAAWLWRDGLAPVGGLDDGGPMGAMGLGWVIVFPDGNAPLMLNKSGGLQGEFSYVAIALARRRRLRVDQCLQHRGLSGHGGGRQQPGRRVVAPLSPEAGRGRARFRGRVGALADWRIDARRARGSCSTSSEANVLRGPYAYAVQVRSRIPREHHDRRFPVRAHHHRAGRRPLRRGLGRLQQHRCRHVRPRRPRPGL
jgi:D-alanyl-D-alanine-carboxypeptidase/D-alanyl-D-alanine-endopeptidase